MKINNQPPSTNHQPVLRSAFGEGGSPVTNIWSSLEQSFGLTAVPANWRRFMNGQFNLFKSAFLQKQPGLSKGYPCGLCACTHEVIDQTPASSNQPPAPPIQHPSSIQHPVSSTQHPDFLALCRCDPPNCPHDQLPLTRADVELWSLNWPKLARALCHAFNLNHQFTDLKIYQTHQIGSWSSDAVPVILTIQSQRGFFHSVITELIARLRQKFILLSPTAKHFDANCQELLANVGAAFFPLAPNVVLNQNGNLHSLKTPGQLFAGFTPAPGELDRSVAERAFALLQQLDSAGPQSPPSLVTVFRLYCIEELSAQLIARKCRCSKAAIIRRLLKIRSVTNSNPRDLRRISTHLAPGVTKTNPAPEDDPDQADQF